MLVCRVRIPQLGLDVTEMEFRSRHEFAFAAMEHQPEQPPRFIKLPHSFQARSFVVDSQTDGSRTFAATAAHFPQPLKDAAKKMAAIKLKKQICGPRRHPANFRLLEKSEFV